MRIQQIISGLLFLVLTSCATTIINDPVNIPLASSIPVSRPAPVGEGLQTGDVMIGLSFSGGGTRAAAFAHGVMEQLAETPFVVRGQQSNLLQQVRFVSGVSGGSVTAAYFGLHGENALADFRERFLIQNAEANLRTSVNPQNLFRILEGGVNDSRGFPKWLDENLFHGATFEQLNRPGRPRIFINASDIFNQSPFIFIPMTFNAFCSDLNAYPLASAVAASAAVPVAFAPVVIQTYAQNCSAPMPPWVTASSSDPDTSAIQRSFATSLSRYRSGDIQYIKLLDGGITDNLGLQGFLLARASANTPFRPMTEENAVRIRELAIFVVNAGQGPRGDWVNTVEGPTGKELLEAVTDTFLASGERNSLDALRLSMLKWQEVLINYRCRLPRSQVRELRGNLTGWNCRDLKIRVTEVGVEALDPATQNAFEQVETRFSLPTNQVDLVIRAGHQALTRNAVYQSLLN